MKGETKVGVVFVVDAYGTFFDDSDASYDIRVKKENMLYKHFNEKLVKPYGREKHVSGGNNWKIDFHVRPKRKFKNWWEDICQLLPRSTMKANVRKEVEEVLKSL